MYSGEAKESHPKIQMYTICEEDKIVYYKKLTKFQRNYSSRLDKFQSRVHEKAIKSNLMDVITPFLKRDPWYTIPEILIEKKDNWGNSVHLEYLHELQRYEDNPIDSLIAVAEGRRDIDSIPDLKLKWDPPISIEAHQYVLSCDLIHCFSASQLSNCGFLPLLEYFLREGDIPILKFVTEGKFFLPLKPNITLSSKLSLQRIPKIAKEKSAHIQTIVRYEEGFPSEEELLIMMRNYTTELSFEKDEEANLLISQSKEQDRRTREEREQDLDYLDKMAAGMLSRNDFVGTSYDYAGPLNEDYDSDDISCVDLDDFM